MASLGPGHNFESSFTQILNRTQQNLNRINQRYATNTGSSANINSSLNFNPPVNASYDPSRLPVNSAAPSLNVRSSLEQSRSAAPNTFRSSGGVTFNPNAPPAPPVPAGRNQVVVDEELFQSILHRLTLLEKSSEEQNSYNLQIQAQEKLFKALDANINDLSLDVKDIHRSFAQQTNRLTVLQSISDSFSLEFEQRKISSMKLETWMNDTEIWREEINSFYSSIKKQEMFFQKHQKELSSLLQESYLTKHDFENFRDRVYLLSQQSVTTALSAWNDSNEGKIKELERQIAIIKLAQTKAVQNEMSEITNRSVSTTAASAEGMDPDLVAKVLGTPIPSEMVIKGAVASEVRSLESNLESKVSFFFI
jgi:hypothetical protein